MIKQSQLDFIDRHFHKRPVTKPNRMASRIIDDVKVIKRTTSATLICIDGEENWFPNSQITLRRRSFKYQLLLPVWLAESKGVDI